MKVIKSDSSGIYAYQKYFKHVQANGLSLVLWQIPPGGKRQVFQSKLNSFHFESNLLHFELPAGASISPELELYVYSDYGPFIFKTSVSGVRESVVSAGIPGEIKILDDSESTQDENFGGKLGGKTSRPADRIDQGFMRVKSMVERTARDQEFLNAEFDSVSLDDEDKLFAEKRESPRARFKEDKFVKVQTLESETLQILKLFDLSRGGMGFITLEPQLFPKDSKILIVGFEGFNLDDPLIAEVKSHRPVDELQIEFKIGCKFDQGQD